MAVAKLAKMDRTDACVLGLEGAQEQLQVSALQAARARRHARQEAATRRDVAKVVEKLVRLVEAREQQSVRRLPLKQPGLVRGWHQSSSRQPPSLPDYSTCLTSPPSMSNGRALWQGVIAPWQWQSEAAPTTLLNPQTLSLTWRPPPMPAATPTRVLPPPGVATGKRPWTDLSSVVIAPGRTWTWTWT